VDDDFAGGLVGGEDDADQRSLGACIDRRRTECGTDHPLFDDLYRYGQRAALDQRGEVLGLLGTERAGDLGRRPVSSSRVQNSRILRSPVHWPADRSSTAAYLRAVTWYLERRHRESFGKAVELEVSGLDGGPVEMVGGPVGGLEALAERVAANLAAFRAEEAERAAIEAGGHVVDGDVVEPLGR
jgi:hypothetical protein